LHSLATIVAYYALNFTFYFTHPLAKIKEGRGRGHLPMRAEEEVLLFN